MTPRAPRHRVPLHPTHHLPHLISKSSAPTLRTAMHRGRRRHRKRQAVAAVGGEAHESTVVLTPSGRMRGVEDVTAAAAGCPAGAADAARPGRNGEAVRGELVDHDAVPGARARRGVITISVGVVISASRWAAFARATGVGDEALVSVEDTSPCEGVAVAVEQGGVPRVSGRGPHLGGRAGYVVVSNHSGGERRRANGAGRHDRRARAAGGREAACGALWFGGGRGWCGRLRGRRRVGVCSARGAVDA